MVKTLPTHHSVDAAIAWVDAVAHSLDAEDVPPSTAWGRVLTEHIRAVQPIPADDLDHVFERFYRVEKSRDRARGGAGIGLAIVKQLVEAGGGRVGAESLDGGTRFWFSLPG